ncbi:MAG: glycosyltransferase family A protein [Candidatus Eisenbacteria bacterium]
MYKPAKASVIIPTFRRQNLLRNLLASLSKQQTRYPFEVIVVNDAPEENLSPFELEFSDISLKVINLSEDHGRSIARNTGVRNSTGDILIFLDDDMTIVETFIEHHMEAHTDPSNAVIGNLHADPEYASDPLHRYLERQGVKKRKSGKTIPPKCFATGNASVSREMFEKVGMFDETWRTYGEDMDLGMRMHYKGAKFTFAEGAVSYNHGATNLEDFMTRMREMGRFTLPFFAKRHPEITRGLWVHLADPIRFGRENPILTLRKAALRVVLTPPFYGLARCVYRLKWLGRLLFPVIEFIRMYNYIRAYRQSLKDPQQGEGSPPA